MKYEEAIKLWGANSLRRDRIDFDEIDSVYISSETSVGCPTCGPETSYEARIYFTRNDKRDIRRIGFYGLDEMLKELFEVSEP